jgi:hypothetical protein
MNEETIRKIAHRRASFKRDVFWYVIVMIFLFLINMWKNPEHLWFVWPAIGWGIAIAFHAWSAYGPERGTLEDEEYKRLKDKHDKGKEL